MSAPGTLRIDAIVDDRERPVLESVGAQLGSRLAAATGARWPVEIRFRESFADLVSDDWPTVVVASALPDLRGHEPIPELQTRWVQRLRSLGGDPRPPVLLCTIFRHVSEAPGDGERDPRPALRERIRHLNLMVVDLSHDTGAGVVDFDRVFSQLGGSTIGTDYRLRGKWAAELGAHAIVSTLLGTTLEDSIDAAILERAQQAHGTLRDRLAGLQSLGAGTPE